MALHWDDPEWKAEHLRKMAAGRARKAAEALSRNAFSKDAVRETVAADPAVASHIHEELPSLTSSVIGRSPTRPVMDTLERTADGDYKIQSRLYACGCSVRIASEQAFDMPAYCPVDGEALALKLLRQLYNALRVRNAGTGYIKGRCSACNIPHFQGKCLHHCPCHQIEVYLELIDSAPATDANHAQNP